MSALEEDFPRGGTSKKPTGSKPVAEQQEVDNLFQTCQSEERQKRKSSKLDEVKEKRAKKPKTDKTGELKLNAAISIDILHLKDLKVGTLLLGCVKEVSDFEVIVGLPSGITGFLPVTNISDAYTKVLTSHLDSNDSLEEMITLPQMFNPGTLLQCVVSSLDTTPGGYMSVKLSINPKQVNKGLSAVDLKAGMLLSGCVESEEDHGYLVDLGLSGTKAFLPRGKDELASNPSGLKVGAHVVCLLAEVKNNGRIVRVSVKPSAVSKARTDAQQSWTLRSLLPGLVVNGEVKKVTKHGLIVEFLSSFTGVVDFLHMDPDKARGYSVGDKVKARVLYVEPSNRTVGLSLREHLVKSPESLACVTSERTGEVLHDCKIISIHLKSGATLQLPDNTVVFAHRNNLKKGEERLNPDELAAVPSHVCRIMEFSPLEQMYMVTLRKNVIEAPFLHYSDFRVGQIVEGTVTSLQPCGLLVKVTNHIKGMVPKTHLADVILKNPEKKYSVGMKIKCRVLAVDARLRKLVLTRKKSLLQSTLPIISTFADARVGKVSHGFVVSAQNFGCIVSFYGNVRGLVPVRELCSETVVSPEKMFYIGQVVKAKVLSCNVAEEKLLLSFKDLSEGSETSENLYQFEIGKEVEVRVTKKISSGLDVSILPEEIAALLPTAHLSDCVSNCAMLWEALSEGDIISNVVCLSNTKPTITLTKKAMIKAAIENGTVAKDFSDIQVGVHLVGWVRSILPYGVFVQFPHNLVGLAPRNAMSDKFISDVEGVFQLGQTVMAKVTNLEEEKKRFLVSLRVSDVSSGKPDSQDRLIAGMRERAAVAEMLTSRDDSELLQSLCSLTVGQKMQLTVDTVQEDETVTLVGDQLRGASIMATPYHAQGPKVSGQKVSAVVLHVNLFKLELQVSLLPYLLVKKKKPDAGRVLTAQVMFVEQDFAVVSLGTSGHLTVVRTTKHVNETFRFESEKLSVGRKLRVEVIETDCEELQGLPLVEWSQVLPSSSSMPESAPLAWDPNQSYTRGDSVTAVVKSIRPTVVLVTLPDGMTGNIHVSQIQDDVKLGSFPTSLLKMNSTITARVIGVKDATINRGLPISHRGFSRRVPELTVLPSMMKKDAVEIAAEEELDNYEPGQNVTCFVSKYNALRKCLEVTVTPTIRGQVELLLTTLKPKEVKHPEKLFKLGQALGAKLVSVDHSCRRLCLSLTDVYSLSPGAVTLGSVVKVTAQFSLVVALPFSRMGRVSIVDLADSYRPNPMNQYPEGKMVRCCVLGEEDGHVQLSLRPSRTNADHSHPVKDAEINSLDQLVEGQLVRGYVSSVSRKGVYIRLSRSVTGCVRFQHVSRYYVSDRSLYSGHVPPNALYTTKVLRVDKKKGQVFLSLLPEDTGKPDVLPEALNLPQHRPKSHEEPKKRKSSVSVSEPEELRTKKRKKQNKTKEGVDAEDNDSGVEVYFREEENEKDKKSAKQESTQTKPIQQGPERLQVQAGFSWGLSLSALKPATSERATQSSDEEEEEVAKQLQKKSRKEKEQEKQQAEKQLAQKERDLMDPSLKPQSSSDFERLVLSSPDSSLVWLQYMAFHLQATEIEQARAVAERALKTISFREEQEKLNVWVASLNLENMYGTQESLQRVFERALQYCEPSRVYHQLADIYAKSNKHKEAEALYKTMVKRFRQERTVWLNYGAFLLKQGQNDAAHGLLQRALKSLPNREHVDLIAKFAQLEFQFGDVERAKTMFEQTLTSYPKRTDLWSVYIDLMIKHGTQKEVRDLFDRVINLSVAVKRIKFFFKRYLEYEKKDGTAESVQAVKDKAREYVEAQANDASG